jgi:hypothetical protein
MSLQDNPKETPTFEREKWEVERTFRDREILIKEREQVTKEAELDLKRKEQAASRWSSPTVLPPPGNSETY